MIAKLRKVIAFGLAGILTVGMVPINVNASVSGGEAVPEQGTEASDASVSGGDPQAGQNSVIKDTTVSGGNQYASLIEEAEDGTLLYFVDAGDWDTSTVSDSEQLGLLNSRTDQVYGIDDKSGCSWGLGFLDSVEEGTLIAEGESGQFSTCYQYQKGLRQDINVSYADWDKGLGNVYDNAVSFRFGWKDGQKFDDCRVRYEFEVPAGTYAVEVGYVNPWGAAFEAELQVNGKALGSTQVGTGSTAVVKGSARVGNDSGKLTVDSVGYGCDVAVSYIKIFKGGVAGTDVPSFDPAVVDEADVDTLLYFVDAGDFNTETVAEGEKLGILNSKTDQFFGTDDKEGYSWGLVSLDSQVQDTLEAAGSEGQCKTKFQYSNNTFDLNRGYADWKNGLSDIWDNVVSLRYARDQGGVFSPYQISYKFDVPEGYYDVEVGFSNTWGNANSVEVEVNDTSIGTADIATGSTGVVRGTVAVEDSVTGLAIDSLGHTATLQVCYIKIFKSEESRYDKNKWITDSGVTFEKLSDGGYKMSNEYFEVQIGVLGQIQAIYITGDEYRTNYVMDQVNHGMEMCIRDRLGPYKFI